MARYRIGGLVIVALLLASTTLVNAGRKTVVRLHHVTTPEDVTVWGAQGSVRADERIDSTGDHASDYLGCAIIVAMEAPSSDPEAGGIPTVTCTAQDPTGTYMCTTTDAGIVKVAQTIGPDSLILFRYYYKDGVDDEMNNQCLGLTVSNSSEYELKAP